MKSIYLNHYKTDKKQFILAVTFLTGYNGIFNITTKNNIFYFTFSVNDNDFNAISIPPGAYEVESSEDEINELLLLRIVISLLYHRKKTIQ